MVFDIKGVPGSRRERIEAAVVAGGGRHAPGPHEAWIAADPFKGSFRVLITGRQEFERSVVFALADDPAVICGAGARNARRGKFQVLCPATCNGTPARSF
jgi:hypothetical protein